MPIERAVINSSPLILLSKCNLLEILPKLFSEIFIPENVFDEIIAGDDDASVNVHKLIGDWLTLISVTPAEDVVSWNLGDGETGVLSYAFVKRPNCFALLDDRAARRCAETLEFRHSELPGFLLSQKGGLLSVLSGRNLIHWNKPAFTSPTKFDTSSWNRQARLTKSPRECKAALWVNKGRQ